MTRREKWLDFGKTMLWVVPLTALIWIWAEREQIAYGTISNVPVKFVHASPDRMVSIVDGDGKISVDVRGPRASIEALRDRLSEGSGALIVTLTDPTLYDGEVYTLAEMIARNEIFTRNAVDVIKTLPSVRIRVEEKVTRAVPVVVRPQDRAIGTFVFEPRTVTIEGPRRVIDALRDDQSVVFAEVASRFAGKQVGQHEDIVNVVPDVGGIHVQPGKVKARVTIERMDEKRIDSIPIALTIPSWVLVAPDAASEKISVDGTLANVLITGPPDAVNSVIKNEYKASVTVSLTPEQWNELKRQAKDQGAAELEVTLTADKYAMPPSVTVLNPGQRVKVRMTRGL